MKLRRILFWIHLAAGVLAGLVILVMAWTGVLLAYQRQVLQWTNREYRVVATGQPALLVAEMIQRVDSKKNAVPSTVTLHADPNAAAEFAFGRDHIVFVNPYTGEVIGESHRLPAFFEEVENIHRWLGASQEKRPIGRAMTGAATLIFLILVTTGPFLWWPREWTWGNLKKIVFFRKSLGGRALFWNWHNVFGIWCFAPLLIIVLSAVVMAYPWATNLIYRMTDNNPPTPVLASTPGRKDWPATGGSHQYVNRMTETLPGSSLTGSDDGSIDKLIMRARLQVPRWRSMTIRMPSERAPLMLMVDEGSGGRPDQRSQFLLDRKTGDIRWETFSSYNSGRRLRTWLRFAHTGEAAGIFGQTLAAIVSCGAAMLVLSGLVLGGKRFLAWRSRN